MEGSRDRHSEGPALIGLSDPALVGVDIGAWLIIHFVVGYGAHRLPLRYVDHDTWLTRERGIERRGRLYVRVFRINRWKRWLPEAGAFFAGGFDKRALPRRDSEYLRRYLAETRRAEVAHWAMMSAAPLFWLWNPWTAALAMPVYAVAVNVPCILSQRYNRIRLRRVLARRERRESPPGWSGGRRCYP